MALLEGTWEFEIKKALLPRKHGPWHGVRALAEEAMEDGYRESPRSRSRFALIKTMDEGLRDIKGAAGAQLRCGGKYGVTPVVDGDSTMV